LRAATESVPGGREPHFKGASASGLAALRWRAGHTGENRQAFSRKGLQPVARLAKPDAILAWYRKLVAEKLDGCKQRRTPGRPRTSSEIEDLVVRWAGENSGWGYDRIVGALANLGYQVSDQTVGNILRRHGIAPVPQ
jgi:hypothetical protein